MKDPGFKREIKQLLDSPTFKAAMSRAATNLEVLAFLVSSPHVINVEYSTQQLADDPELMEKMKLMSQVHAGNKEL